MDETYSKFKHPFVMIFYYLSTLNFISVWRLVVNSCYMLNKSSFKIISVTDQFLNYLTLSGFNIILKH